MAVFQRAHAGRIISQNDVAKLFADAYVTTATTNNAINGFKTTGLFLTNRYMFHDSDCLPASISDNPLNPTEFAQPIETPLPLKEAHRATPSLSMLEVTFINQNLSSLESIEEDVTPSLPYSPLRNLATMLPRRNSQGYVDNLNKQVNGHNFGTVIKPTTDIQNSKDNGPASSLPKERDPDRTLSPWELATIRQETYHQGEVVPEFNLASSNRMARDEPIVSVPSRMENINPSTEDLADPVPICSTHVSPMAIRPVVERSLPVKPTDAEKHKRLRY